MVNLLSINDFEYGSFFFYYAPAFDLTFLTMSFKTLILSPHIDDETLGAFSFLDNDAFVVFFGVEDREGIPKEKRLKELRAVSEERNFQFEVLDHLVNSYQENRLIRDIENCINSRKPEYLLIPARSYNQDHRAVYQAGIIACRPHDQNWFVPKVLVYEQPQTMIWEQPSDFQPNYFKEIDVNQKVDTYKLHESQVRGHRSEELIRSIAKLRGSQANVNFAEGFMIKRMIA